MNSSDQKQATVAVGSTGGSALTLACRLAENIRETDAAARRWVWGHGSKGAPLTLENENS